MLTGAEKIELLELVEYEAIQKARIDFYAFCQYMDPVFFTKNKKHLIIIADALQKLENGEIKKLMISLPPRAGKSYIISLYCSWVLGLHSDGSIMRNAYAAELAEKFSYDIRLIVQMEKYLKVFPNVKLRQDKKAINDWALNSAKQTSYFCAGVGGAITGKGCNLLAILDDPIKNFEEALNVNYLEKVWNWYTSTHKSRLEKGCKEIQIATRWSKHDVIGKLLDNESDEWYKIVIPALDNEGKSFCEEIQTTEEYLKTKKLNDSVIWEAEYMQNPIESKGLLYPANELNYFEYNAIKDRRKEFDSIQGYTDVADEGADYLCSLIGWIKGTKAYIVDVVFTQEPIEITEGMVANQIISNSVNEITIESNNGGKQFARNVENLVGNKSNAYINTKQNTTNKETRIIMSSGQIKQNFYFRSDYEIGSDYDKYMRQLTSYVKMGKNKHDDAADATTGLNEIINNNRTVFISDIRF